MELLAGSPDRGGDLGMQNATADAVLEDGDAGLSDMLGGSELPITGVSLETILGLLLLVGLAVGAYYLARYVRGQRRERRLTPSGDTTRYALASAVLLGSHYRRRILA